MRNLYLALIIFLLLSACTPIAPEPEVTTRPGESAESGDSVDPGRPSPTRTLPPPPSPSPVPSRTPYIPPTPSPTPLLSTPPTPTPPLVEADPLPRQERITLNVVAHFGGAPGAIAVDGTLAYVGFGPRLAAIDVADPAAPRHLGQSDLLPGAVEGIAVREGLAFVGNGGNGLLIFDVSSLGDPTLLGQWRPPAEERVNLTKVMLAADRAYALSEINQPERSRSLLQIDVRDPGAPRLVDITPLSEGARVHARGNGIFVTQDGRFQVRDLHTPSQILADIPVGTDSYGANLFLRGDQAYVLKTGAEGNGIQIYDISDPANPTAQGNFTPVEGFFFGESAADAAWFVSAETMGEFGFCGSILYFVRGNGLDQPFQAGRFEPENCVRDMTLQDNLLYLVGRAGFMIFDLSDLEGPTLRGHFRPPHGFHDAQAIARRENVVYILSSEGHGSELRFLDLGQTPPAPLRDPISFAQSPLLNLHIWNDFLMASLWNGDFNLLDISQPANPTFLYSATGGELMSAKLGAVAVADHFLYAPAYPSGANGPMIAVVSIADPAQPEQVELVEAGRYIIDSLVVENGRLYALSTHETKILIIYDLQNPAAPKEIARLPLPAEPDTLAVIEDTAYAFCGHGCNRLFVIDVGNGNDSGIVGQWRLPSDLHGVASDEAEGLLYLETRDGIYIVDAAQPERPLIVGHAPHLSGRITVDPAGGLFIAAGAQGMYQIELVCPDC